MADALDDIAARLARASPEMRARLEREVAEATKGLVWIPSPGPQTQAYFSPADVVLYGGEPGGGKTDLLVGLAFTAHEKSLIMRRQYTDLGSIVSRMLEVNGGKSGFNGSPPPSLKTDKVSIELGAANKIGDEMSWMGRAHDLLGIDEATQFAESQVRFLMGWVRSTKKGQRTRVVLATNPPLAAEGLWIIEMFAPWLDENYPNPAAPGELRWVVSTPDGDRWVDGPEPIELDGRTLIPLSRTYIPSSLDDNPFLRSTSYRATLDGLPESVRSVLMGGFRASFKDQDNQVIPTAWIRAAVKRWAPRPPAGVPMCAVGVDPSGGGNDPLAIARRYDGWFAPMVTVPGKDIPFDKAGSFTAAQVVIHRRDLCLVVLDMGGGYGSGCYEALHGNGIPVKAYKGANSSRRKTRDHQLGFYNKRSELIYRFREALDPEQPGGSPIMLPDDPELIADLAAPRLEPDAKVIKVEPKEDVIKRLGRSTNKGDAVVLAWSDGPKALTDWENWVENARQERGEPPRVIMGRRR